MVVVKTVVDGTLQNADEMGANVGGDPMLPLGDDNELNGERMSLILDVTVVREAGLANCKKWPSDDEQTELAEDNLNKSQKY